MHGVHGGGAPGAHKLPLNCNTTTTGEQKSGCLDNLEAESSPFLAEASATEVPAPHKLPLAGSNYETFRAHADMFGRSKSEIALRPLQRDETDAVLDGLIKPLLEDYAPRIVARAIASTLGIWMPCASKRAELGLTARGRVCVPCVAGWSLRCKTNARSCVCKRPAKRPTLAHLKRSTKKGCGIASVALALPAGAHRPARPTRFSTKPLGPREGRTTAAQPSPSNRDEQKLPPPRSIFPPLSKRA